jgi:hypothetical protein
VKLLHDYKIDDIKIFSNFINDLKNEKKSIDANETILNTNQELLNNLTVFKNNTDIIMKYADNFNNLYEDFLSAVRIYARLNLYDKNDNWQKIVSLDEKSENLKYMANIQDRSPIELLSVNDIYSVAKANSNQNLFDGIADNKASGQWINKPLRGVFEQLQSGYNVFLFGYGFSGSGKTYTLFGKYTLDEPGLVQIGIKSLLKQGFKVSPYSAFDIYGRIQFKGRLSELTKSSKIQYYPTKNKDDNDKVLYNTDYISKQSYNFTSDSVIEVEKSINQFLVNINEVRKTPFETKKFGTVKCVKATINNKESSRGHLFVIFEILNKETSVKNYLIAVDMAGIEDPLKIVEASYRIRNKDGTVNKLIIDKIFEYLKVYENEKNGEMRLPYSLDNYEKLLKDNYNYGTTKIYYIDSRNNINVKKNSDGKYIKNNTNEEVSEGHVRAVIQPFIKPKEIDLKPYFDDNDIPSIEKELTEPNIINTILEGAFINETINHLKWFLLEKRERKQKIEYQICGKNPIEIIDSTDSTIFCDYSQQYNPSKYFYNPINKKGRDDILILKTIENLEKLQNTSNKPAKFIMMSVLNVNRFYNENIYKQCDQNNNNNCNYLYECESKNCEKIGAASQIKFGFETLKFVKQLLDVDQSSNQISTQHVINPPKVIIKQTIKKK